MSLDERHDAQMRSVERLLIVVKVTLVFAVATLAFAILNAVFDLT